MNNIKTTYKAGLSQGRQKLCVIFCHPMIDGVRVRRGLGTDNREEALAIVTDINKILSDSDFHKLGARELAERQFHKKAVSAFYDHDRLRTALIDPWEKRDVLPLPGEGYSVVQIVGSFGVGKTTLVRQLIGTDHGKGSFPAKGKGRTTICDTEIICAPGDYAAVVSFASRDRILGYIEECVESAVRAAAEGLKDDAITRRFLEHSEQRFRISYILGKPLVQQVANTENGELDYDEEDDESDDAHDSTTTSEPTDRERDANTKRIIDWIARCKAIAAAATSEVENEMGKPQEGLSPEMVDEFFERLYRRLKINEAMDAVVDEVLDAVEERFSLLAGESVDTDNTGWPVRWQMTSADRVEFLQRVARFSSNYERQFGRLFTPLVDGIRVKGPFRPMGWFKNDEVPPLVILDGEGLGHVSTTATVVPTSVTRRFDMAHAILLVDTAETAMTAGPQALLRRAVTTGQEKKLAVVFTHFDQMQADTFRDGADKQNHVTASLEQAIAGLDDALDSQTGASRRLRKQLEDRVFCVGRLNERLDDDSKKTKGTRKALNKLMDFLVSAGQPEAPTEATPCYDLAYLFPGIEKAAGQFQQAMNAQILGEHWKRIEALTRRFAKQWDDGYLHLRPVAALQTFLAERLAVFWATPKSWKPNNSSQEAKDAAIQKVTREFSSRMEKYISERFRQDYLPAWSDAYARSGPGSGRARARDIRSIDEEIAPVPSEERNSKLFDDIRRLCREAIEAAGFEIAST
jgi:hypothetical protein